MSDWFLLEGGSDNFLAFVFNSRGAEYNVIKIIYYIHLRLSRGQLQMCVNDRFNKNFCKNLDCILYNLKYAYF